MSKEQLYKKLGQAIEIATNAHAGQFDKGGKPYILHPLHLMNQMMYDIELAIIAVLHDVAEDSDYTIKDFETLGFSYRVTDALTLLTHDKNEHTYDEYIDRICTSYDAVRVKRKDLEHNSSITRLKGLREKDFERTKKYHEAYIKLGKARDLFKENKLEESMFDEEIHRTA